MPAALITIVDGPETGRKMAVVDAEQVGSLGDVRLDQAAVAHASNSSTQNAPRRCRLPVPDGRCRIVLRHYPTPPTLIIFGAVHAAQPLTRLAKLLGYRVLISDAREKLATIERFPEADEVIVAWPDEAIARFPSAAIRMLRS